MKIILLIQSVQSTGYKKSAINGIHIVKKLINWDRTYEKGVLSPSKVLLIKVLFVNTLLKKSLISCESAFFLKDELKNIFFKMFKICICMIYSLLTTTCFKTLKIGFKINSMILLHKLGLSI